MRWNAIQGISSVPVMGFRFRTGSRTKTNKPHNNKLHVLLYLMYRPLVQCLDETPDFTMQLCRCLVGWLHSKWQIEHLCHPFLPLRMQSTHDITYSTIRIIARGQTFELLNCALTRHLATQQAAIALHSDKTWKFCLVLFTACRPHDHVTSKRIMSSGSSYLLVLEI